MLTNRKSSSWLSSLLFITALVFAGVQPVPVFAQGNSGLPEIPALAGATWYVAPTGNDSNSCTTTGSPCLTINGAIGKAADGDTIKVAVGTYTGSGNVVVIISKNINISGGWNVTFTSQSDFSTIDGENSRGGVDVYGGVTVSLERFIIKNSNMGFPGILIEGVNSNSLTLYNVSVNNNTSYLGGGIHNEGNLTLNNSTVSNNSASSSGGGIYNDGTLTLNNTTISNNTAALLGGGIYQNTGTIAITNSILAGNFASGFDSDCSGTLTSGGYNIIRTTSGCTISASTGDQFNINPQLGAFLPIQGYHPLTAGSPAINAGNPATCLPTDQRSVARVGTCDIGAYEYTTPGSAVSLLVLSGSGQRAELTAAISKPLQAVTLDSLGSPVSGVSVTFTAPGSGASGTFANTGTNTTSVNTDAGGVATTSIFTANSQVGAYIVSASAIGLGSVNFNLQNVAWYVATTGNDTNSCSTPASPCLTINGAIGKAADGDTIKVAAGTYIGTGTEVVLINKNVTLSGGWNGGFTTQGEMSTIDGQGARRGITTNIDLNALVALERFVVQNGFSDYGGGISSSFGTLTLTNSMVSNNTATNSGGIYQGNGILNINQTTVNNNTGGGIYISGDTSSGGIVTLNNSAVNTNTGYGINNLGFLTINSSTVNGNTGIGISNYWYDATINSSTISNNTGGDWGGGLANITGNVMINNTTITGNTAFYQGGGIFAQSGTVSINNSTISLNTTTSSIEGGGGIFNNGATVTLRNTILAGNTTSGTGPDCNGYSSISSLGYNLIGNNSGCTFSGITGDLIGTSTHPINPGITPLQDNGGPTFTHALMSGSPAINAGNPASPGSGGNACVSTDQRGTPRPEGPSCDIGAFEGEVPAILVNISGNAGIAGATLKYTDGTPKIATADSNGNYSFPVLSGWYGTVTPFKVGYNFSPVSRTYNDLVADQTSQNFAALPSIQDPSFEAYRPNPYWSELSTNFWTPLCTVADCGDGAGVALPRTGSVWGWFGGIQADEIASLSQSIIIPSGVPDLKLQFYFWVGAAQPGSDTADVFTAKIDGVTVFSANATQQSSYPAYKPVLVDISSFGNGASHTLIFSSTTTDQAVTFNLDDVSLTDVTFLDVPSDYWSLSYIERLVNSGITSGCGNGNYCPENPVTRAQMAVFLLKGIHGSSYAPPAVGGSTGFNDVAIDYWAAAWIKQLAAESITGGCGGGNYCPDNPVTRAQMAVFLLKAKYSSSYSPPAIGSDSGFTDVAVDYWAAAWIKQLAAEGITSGCAAGVYCPETAVNRAQMAVFLVKAFNLP